ncbi:MAG: maleate cis-trans isomerase [Actinomycetota bacterium]|nr:maleate cis-trans isomerase [Actinomycetota bacterium]
MTPHADVGPESEIRAMAPKALGVHAARVPFGGMATGGAMDPTIPLAPVRAFVEPPHIDDAVALLAAAPVAVIGIGFTSSAYVVGAVAEKTMIDRLQGRSSGTPVVATCASAVDALRRLGVTRVAVVDPPWFDQELNRLGAEYFSSQGVEVAFHASCGLPSNQRSINPPELYDWIRAHTPDSVQAVFVGGNGFRSVGVIAALEEELGRPVLTANQVLLWGMLRAIRSQVSPRGYGLLFTLTD